VIRTNLSTRPFYNERIVHIWLLAFLVVVIAATAFNATRILQYSQSDTELSTQAARDESRAAELRASAARLRTTVERPHLQAGHPQPQQCPVRGLMRTQHAGAATFERVGPYAVELDYVVRNQATAAADELEGELALAYTRGARDEL